MHFPHFGVNTPASSPHVVKFCCQWHNWFCHGTVTTHKSVSFGSPILLNILPKDCLSLDCSNIWLLLSFTAFFLTPTDEISFSCYLVVAADTCCCPCCFLLFKSLSSSSSSMESVILLTSIAFWFNSSWYYRFAVLHTAFMLPGGLLQHEPVPLHRAPLVFK